MESFIAKPGHALILAGPEGSGKGLVARWLSMRLLGLQNDHVLNSYPYYKIIEPNGQSISIDTVRELLQFTKLKVAMSNGAIQRIATIEQAHLLTIEAQNALLKLLEEPPEGTLLVLTAANDFALLPTIRSRAQSISLQTPSRDDLLQHFTARGFQQAQNNQAYLMSGGLPGLMHALLEDSDEHPLVQAAKQARELLQANTFERLTHVDSLAKQREACSRVLFMLSQMAHAALEQAAGKSTGASKRGLARWHQILEASYDAQTSLQANAQPKLVLINLMLCL